MGHKFVVKLVGFIGCVFLVGCNNTEYSQIIITGKVNSINPNISVSNMQIQLYTHEPALCPPLGELLTQTSTDEKGNFLFSLDPQLIRYIVGKKIVVFANPSWEGWKICTISPENRSIHVVLVLINCEYFLIEESIIPIAYILAQPCIFKDQLVTVIGSYRGWDLHHETRNGPPTTFSDWVVSDLTGALYVSALSEAKPDGLMPWCLEHTNVSLRVKGFVRLADTGQPFLEAAEIELLSPIPPKCSP